MMATPKIKPTIPRPPRALEITERDCSNPETTGICAASYGYTDSKLDTSVDIKPSIEIQFSVGLFILNRPPER